MIELDGLRPDDDPKLDLRSLDDVSARLVGRDEFEFRSIRAFVALAN